MYYKGDYPTSHTAVTMPWDSFAATTGAPSATTNFAAGDIQIYKDGGTTQRSSSAGITVTTSFDSNTGLQMIVIDLSDNTDAGFYAAGHEYDVAVADVTIDSQTVRFWVGSFSIERAGGVLALLKARTPNAAAGASGGLLISGSNSGTTTLGALTITGATTYTGNVVLSDGLTVSAPSTSNRAGITVTGNGTGAGVSVTGGNGATGNGMDIIAAATNSKGLNISGLGTGAGMIVTGGLTGIGLNVVGGGTSGDGVKVTTTSGHGVNLAPVGTSKHGLFITGGNGGTSDGVSAVAGTGGVPIRGNITGNLVGTVSTLTTYTGNTPQTGDVYPKVDTEVATLVTGVADIQARIPAALTANGNIKSSFVELITTALTEGAAGRLKAAFTTFFNVAAPVATTASVDQTGDSYARLGAPAGASISADIAAVRVDTNTTIPNLIAALNNISSANVKTQVVAALNTDTYAEPGQGTPASTTTLVNKIGYLYKAWRNRSTQTGSAYNLMNDDASTVDQKTSVSDDGTTFDRGEITTGP